MNEYEKELERDNDELRDQLIKLSRCIKPIFKLYIDEDVDVIKSIQLYIKLNGDFNPYIVWKTDPLVPVTNETDSKNMLMCVELKSPGKWEGNMYRFSVGNEKLEKEPIEIHSNNHEEVMHKMLNSCGLNGFVYGIEKEKFMSEEERLKPIVDVIADYFAKHNDLKTYYSNNISNFTVKYDVNIS